MSDLISRQAAIDVLNEYFGRIGKLKRRGLTKGEKAISLDVVGAIKTLPTIEAEPVKHGHWININEGKWSDMQVLQCSACGEIDSRMYLNDSYCPNCGAKMDEVEE